VSCLVDRIGFSDGTLTLTDVAGGTSERRKIQAAHHKDSVDPLITWLEQKITITDLVAIGHRVVHGGPRYSEPQQLTPEVMGELRRLSPYDPEHLPAEIELIETLGQRYPSLPQVACFDTAFHRDMPRVARLLPIPRRYDAAGVQRYGFHGLSYAYLMEELRRIAPHEAQGRVILAHLGNGASMAAVRGGKSIDTSMGFTPTAGLPMSTRSGDLDPGLLSYLSRTEGMTVEQFHMMVNRQSGLLGVSETSSDLRDLLASEPHDPRAAEAVALFCYQAKKWIGSFAAALGGLDTLVFSGGIGENSAVVRARICEGLGFLGVALDEALNLAGATVISKEESRVTVRVIPTDEESEIARSVLQLLDEEQKR
jgi:acetate kinase